MGKVLVFSKSPEDREYLYNFCRPLGLVYTAPTAEKAGQLLQTLSFSAALVDAPLSEVPAVKFQLLRVPVVLLAGTDEARLAEAVRLWPEERLVDYILVSSRPLDAARNRRVLQTAREYARLREDVSQLAGAKASADKRLKRVYDEIRDLGGAISRGLSRELEKRAALETQYARFQHQKKRFEDILRRLYAANDVNSLLDIVFDIKDIVGAGGISLYILEENDSLGQYLKPLVWDDAFLAHADFSRHVALLASADFAALIARTGAPLRMESPGPNPNFSIRYRRHLRSPLSHFLGAPLRSDKEVIGVVEVYNKTAAEAGGAGFNPDDEQVLRGLSEHIALAMTKLNLIQHDALTGLLRPDPFFERVAQKIETRSQRRQEAGAHAMVMGDVDWFKNYNDRNGHEAGNRLLRELAGVMKASIREEDLLCRYGGEEFLFFLTGVKNIEEATLLTERIRKAVDGHAFPHQEAQPRRNLTMSFGVTLLPEEEFDGSETVGKIQLKKFAHEADLALSEAKGKKLAALRVDPRMIAKNKVCAFVRETSQVMSKTMILGVSNEKVFVEKRQYERYYASTLCIYRENGGHRVAATVDMSLGGARISSDGPFPLAKMVDLFFVLGNQATPITAEVIYSQKVSAQSALFYTGLKFHGLTADDRRILESYFLSLGK